MGATSSPPDFSATSGAGTANPCGPSEFTPNF
jgi:hypothetical protein